MATVVTGQPEDKDKQPQEGAISVSGAPSAAVGGGLGQPSGPSAPATRKASGSGRFTNIQSYLQANQGSGEKIAGQIGQKVGQQTQKLGEAVQTAQGVNPQLEAERQRIAQASGFAQQVQEDPTKLLDKTQQFRQLATGQTGLQPIQQQAQQAFDVAQGQLGQVQQLSNLTGSEGGRFELLRQAMGRPSYTRGQQRLDQLLIQSSGGDILGQLQKDTAAKARAGEQLLGSTRGDIENQLADLGTQAQEAQKLLTGTLGTWDDPTTPENEATGALGGLQTDLTTRAGQQQARLEDMYNRARAGLQSGEIDRDVAEMLGLTGLTIGTPGLAPGRSDVVQKLGPAGQQLLIGDISSEDLLSRLQKGFSTVTPSSVATEADYNRLQALKQLAGQTGPTPIELDKTQLGQAGVAAKMNAEQLQKDIQSRLGALQQQYEGTAVDALASQKLLAGLASRSMDQLLNKSDTELLQQFNPGILQSANKQFVANEAAKIRKDLESRKTQFANLEAQQAQTNIIPDEISGGNFGLTYGQLTSGQGLTSALQRYLQAMTAGQDEMRTGPTRISSALMPLVSDQAIMEAMGSGFGTEMQRRLQQQYTDLGLGRTLRIK
jgi:hypothetical protein